MKISGLQRALAVYHVLNSTFGQRMAPLFIGLMILLIRIMVTLGQWLDLLFYPSLSRKEPEQILIVAGNPRSGTTFLHRYLISLGLGTGSELRQLLWPSIILQKLITPLLPLLERVSPASHHDAAAHQTSLTSAETDDAALFFRYLDGFFLYGFLLAWSEDDLFPWFDHRVRDTSVRDYRWLTAIWKRVLVQSGKTRIIPKLFSVGVNVPRFLEKFPQSRILYIVRDPLEMIPSGMSLVTGVLDARYGFWKLPDARRDHYLNNLYRALVELLLRFHDDWINGRIDKQRVMVLPYPRMMTEFEQVMKDIFTFSGVGADKTMLDDIRKTAAKQRAWKSRHKYDLERFGLSEKQIRRDCRNIYRTFLSGKTTEEVNPS